MEKERPAECPEIEVVHGTDGTPDRVGLTNPETKAFSLTDTELLGFIAGLRALFVLGDWKRFQAVTKAALDWEHLIATSINDVTLEVRSQADRDELDRLEDLTEELACEIEMEIKRRREKREKEGRDASHAMDHVRTPIESPDMTTKDIYGFEIGE